MRKLVGILSLITTTFLFSKELTLQEAVDLSLENGKEIKKSEYSKKNASLNVKKAFKTALPVVTYTGKYNQSEHTRRTMLDANNKKTGFSQSVGIYQPIFRGGAIGRRVCIFI